MNNKSMTEFELKEFLTALRDNCGNKRKTQWYNGLIEDIGIAFTEDIPDEEMLEKAKKLWQNGNKLEAVKLMCQSGYRLKDAKNYCDENFGLLASLPKSTENLSKIKDKDEWLNEVRGNEKLKNDVAEEILDKYYFPRMHWKYVNRKNVLKAMEEFAKQYSNSKLEELEKWIDERNSGYKEYVIKHTSVSTSAAIAELDIIKDKIKSLKQE